QHAHCGSAYGNYLAAALPAGLEFDRSLLRQLSPLSMHAVLSHVLDLDRLERAETDVQRDKGLRNGALLEPVENCGREVQSGGRRRHGACAAGIDRLVALPILSCPAALADVGRQWCVTVTPQKLLGRRGRFNWAGQPVTASPAHQTELERPRLH